MTRSERTEAAGQAARKPTSVPELVDFYYTFVKPLYSAVQLTNHLPVEVLFEINAAFDHLTRVWAYDEPEPEVVGKAYSHLKRSCLDIFKLHVKEARRQFDELRKIDTSIIDNGDFDRRLLECWQRLKATAREARVKEGDPKKDDAQAIYAFALWLPVYEDCVTLEKDFYCHARLDWARKMESWGKWRERLIGGLCVGILASLIATAIWWAGGRAKDGITNKRNVHQQVAPASSEQPAR
jgi:hypothetical protein